MAAFLWHSRQAPRSGTAGACRTRNVERDGREDVSDQASRERGPTPLLPVRLTLNPVRSSTARACTLVEVVSARTAVAPRDVASCITAAAAAVPMPCPRPRRASQIPVSRTPTVSVRLRRTEPITPLGTATAQVDSFPARLDSHGGSPGTRKRGPLSKSRHRSGAESLRWLRHRSLPPSPAHRGLFRRYRPRRLKQSRRQTRSRH